MSSYGHNTNNCVTLSAENFVEAKLTGMSMRDFKVLHKLGEGAFSVVYKVCRLSDNKEYALKKVPQGLRVGEIGKAHT